MKRNTLGYVSTYLTKAHFGARKVIAWNPDTVQNAIIETEFKIGFSIILKVRLATWKNDKTFQLFTLSAEWL